MKNKFFKKSKIPVFLMVFVVVLNYGCSNSQSGSGNNVEELTNNASTEIHKTLQTTEIAVEQPPFTEGIFPCNDCHSEIEPNPVRRELVDMHDDITAISVS